MVSLRVPSLLIFIFSLVFLVSCAGPGRLMRPVSEEVAVSAPNDGKSLVVFMRPSDTINSLQPSVYLIRDDRPSLIGIVAFKKKVAFETAPGEYLFMSLNHKTTFLPAELLANKSYYVVLLPDGDNGKAQFDLQPVRFNQIESDTFNKWLSDCDWMEKSPQAEAWFNSNSHSVIKKYEENYPKWQAYDKSKRLALFPDDGI